VSSPDNARCFVALRLGAEAQARVASAIAELARCGAAVRWMQPGHVHVTLKFLGSVPRARLAAIAAALDTGDMGTSLALGLGGVGRFPAHGPARVLWAGLRGDLETLGGLQRRIEAALTAQGLLRERRLFRPHLTLGRVKDQRGLAPLLAAMSGLELRTEPEPIDSFALYESRLQPQGAEHVVLRRIALR
jgi:2'-5' RNA ligase